MSARYHARIECAYCDWIDEIDLPPRHTHSAMAEQKRRYRNHKATHVQSVQATNG